MDNKIDQWRDGLLSDAEMLGWLLHQQAGLIETMTVVYTQIQEVHTAMIADQRMKRLGV